MIGITISHYKILEKLGEGGIRVICTAEDTKPPVGQDIHPGLNIFLGHMSLYIKRPG